jgi:pimeloyl-ACP methyl ester carboxylesterase
MSSKATLTVCMIALTATVNLAPQVVAASSAEMPGKEFKEGHVAAGGFHLRYQEAGPKDAPVLVSLPGSAGLEMSRAKDQLIKHFRVIEINPPGWGDDPELTREMNQDEIGKILGEAANQLVTGKYHVLGTSMGGGNALWLTAAFPERVKSVVLEGSMAPLRLSQPSDMTMPLITREGVRKMLASQAAGSSPYPTPPADPAKPWATKEYVGKQMGQRFRMMKWVQADVGNEQLYAKVRESKAPILALVGDKDGIIKPSVESYYREVFPQSKFVLIPGAGHDIQNTQTDAFVKEVTAFIKQHD